MFENVEVLNELIVGRVEPHIYAFSTNTVPNYLKIGDTYRPVSLRLNEWKKHFPTLKEVYKEKATITDDIFFRDYAVHQYLEDELSKKRLMPTDLKGIYYSNEFFKDIDVVEVIDAIIDIKDKFEKNIDTYQYYNSKNRLPETYTYASTGEWQPRPNQRATIDNFMKAINNDRKNILMYAVMRFGKSFTSLCCAKEMNAKIVLVVSAKADVCEEWKKTVQQADNFNRDYVFLARAELLGDEHIVKTTLDSDKGVVVFLTLQDLQGEAIKDKHKEIFGNSIDLLIIDETHYGARAEKYGQVLKDKNYVIDTKEKHADEDYIDYDAADKELKVFETNIKLHLSGTPYRILMGSEFTKEDIIAFYQFTDIVKEQEEWDENYLLEDINADGMKRSEWDNPYYGFPQMVRFAFNPSKEAQAKLAELRANGNTYAFSALFKPRSIKKETDDSHKEFIYKKEVLDLFEVIDGSKQDDELLSFLDYAKIKNSNMCRHIVCVLPYCASCDALEKLLVDNKDGFKNIQNYTIINISGIDNQNEYKSVNTVKQKITKCEENREKTITLTVNRMLTGSTVEQWDTMLFLKDTASPQEYDQAIFRLQNQYIKTFVSESGSVIKFNMKPQTLLVDFDPHRMFSMQEQKSLIYNANTEKSGNQRLEERMKEELKISPIITMNKNKILQVESADILSAISAYSKDRGVIDETRDIPVDMLLLDIDIIKSTITAQAELGAKKGLQIDAHQGDENDFDAGQDNNSASDDSSNNNKESKDTHKNNENMSEPDRQKLENKFRMYYSRLLFYTFLSEDVLKSLDDILSSLNIGDNKRIAHNLSLNKEVLRTIRQNINLFILSQLDYKIQNINALSHDETVEPVERAIRAINKFGKLSESEVTIPLTIANDMVALLPDESFDNIKQDDVVILDIASKTGEFTIAICERAKKLGIELESIKSSVFSIPTSPVAYEFTRKIYLVLGLDINCIATSFTSYDLLETKVVGADSNIKDDIDCEKISRILKQKKLFSEITLDDEIEEGDEMKFEAIVGNPPYQVSDGGAQASARPIYHNFVDISKSLNPLKLTMIMPSRWYAGGKGLDEFRNRMINDRHIEQLNDFLHPEEIFPDTNNRGGICYFLWNTEYDNSISNVNIISHNGNGEVTYSNRSMKTRNLDIFVRDNIGVEILDKVIPDGEMNVMTNHISPRKPFGLDGNFIKTKDFHDSYKGLKEPVKCYGKAKRIGYVNNDKIVMHIEWIDTWKVLMPYANNIGTELNDDNQNTFVSEPNSICTETFLIAGINLALDKETATNLSKYLRTRFARFLLGLAKISQHATAKTYRFVPVQDFTRTSDIFWNADMDNIDIQLYEKYRLTQNEIDYIQSKIKPMK